MKSKEMRNRIVLCGYLGLNTMCIGCVYASILPEIPFEVVVNSKKYHLSTVRQEPIGENDLTASKAPEIYAAISKPPLKDSEWKALEKIYPTFVSCKVENSVLTFTFDYLKYFQQFNFDGECLTLAFSKGAVPFVHEYVWQCELSSTLSKNETLIYKIVFDRFRGGNLMLTEERSEGVVRCITQENFPGQVWLEDASDKI